MNVEIDIYKFADKYNLTESEELALKYIVNNFEKSLEIGVRGVAKKCFASTSVVMNLAKKMEYKGFVDMVYRLEFNIKKQEQDFQRKDDYYTKINHIKLKKFKKIISDKRKPIFVHGLGFSSSVVRYISDKLMILGYNAMRTEYMETMKDKYEGGKGVLIIISKTGETSNMFPLCEKARESKVPIILFTGAQNSTVEKMADLTFRVKDSNPFDDRNLEKNDFFGNAILFFENLMNLVISQS